MMCVELGCEEAGVLRVVFPADEIRMAEGKERRDD